MDVQLRTSNHGQLDIAVDGKSISKSVPFMVEVRGRLVTAVVEPGSQVNSLASRHGSVLLSWQAEQLGQYPVWEFKLNLENRGKQDEYFSRLDPLSLELQGGAWQVHSFASAWGDEFRAQIASTRHDSYFGVRSGRSSHGQVPVVYFVRESDQMTLVVAPAWSGNWHVDVQAGGYITAGISRWNLDLAVRPEEKLAAPSVVVALSESLKQAQLAMQSAVRDHLLARSARSDQMPLEWNHWWPYEDVEVTESVILENARLAKQLPVDSIVVDAGWFGESDTNTEWTKLRGDWHLVNLARFPSGLENLGQQIKKLGFSPGIWVEIEAIGAESRLRFELPEAIARNDEMPGADPSYRVGTVSLDPADTGFLGYVCLGSEAGWNHAYRSLASVLNTIQARWLKVDFNIDPGFGCTRTDHGHGRGDGLYRHYLGLYKLLDQIRSDFPELVLEACSSGGLRIDLELVRHVHCFFLSDPDYTEHHLEALWGAAHLLPPMAILHWPWSWWRNGYEPSQLDWNQVDPEFFDVILRAAMIHRMGISYPLPKLRPELFDRLKKQLEIYSAEIAPVLKDSTLLSLTPSTLSDGRGARAGVWQLSANVGEENEVHFIAYLGVDPGLPPASFKLQALSEDGEYLVTNLENGAGQLAPGSALTDEFLLGLHSGARSWIVSIRPSGKEK